MNSFIALIPHLLLKLTQLEHAEQKKFPFKSNDSLINKPASHADGVVVVAVVEVLLLEELKKQNKLLSNGYLEGGGW